MKFPFEEQQQRELQVREPQRPRKKKRAREHNIKAGNAKTIARATAISMIGFMLAKMTGFLREILIIPKLGYGVFSDAYHVAFLIPDFLYEMLLGGAVAAAITPTLASGIENNEQKKTWHSVSIFISIAISVTIIALLLSAVLMPWLTPLLNPKKDPAVIAAAIPISRILLIQCLFMMMAAFVNGILNAYKRFGFAAFGSALYNICYMVALILLGAESVQGVKRVAWGVVGSAMVYWLYQVILARREIRMFRFNPDYTDPGFRKLLRLAIPTLLSGSVLHINMIIMNMFTNQFVGAATTIRQANNTWALPYGIISIAIGSVMLPNLTGFFAKKNFKRVRSLYTSSLRKALFLVTPFAVIFAVLNFHTIQAIFQWNPENYTNEQVAVTGSVLVFFCVSLIAQTFIFITNQAFYARKVTRLALFTGIITLILNPTFCWLYTKVFDFGIRGIAMAHASYSIISAIILYQLYCRHIRRARPYRMLPFMIRVAICAAVTAPVMFALRTLPIHPANKILQLIVYGIYFLIGLFTYYTAGIAIRLREALNFQQQLRKLVGLDSLA